MAASPKYKFFNANGEYIASLKHPEDAAVLLSVHGIGASVRCGHSKSDTILVVTEANHEAIADSYDRTASLILSAT